MALILVVAGGSAVKLQAAGLSFRAGMGYDFLSQQYFLDTASLQGSDSVLVNWELKTNYLDDIKGQFSLTYSPYLDRRFELESSYEQTPEFIRARFIGDFHPKWGQTKLDFNGEFELRNRYHDSSSFGDSYYSGEFKAKLSTPLSGSLSAGFQFRGDGVAFQSPSSFSYNYFRLGGKVDITKSFENYSFATARTFVTVRQVPDSLELNYLNIGIEGSLLGFFEGVELDLLARLERKDYNQPSNKDDHYRYELAARNKITLGKGWFSRQDIDFELTLYSSADPVNYDYGRAGLGLLYGYENNSFNIAVGPDFEYMDEQQNDFSQTEDYFESGAKVDLEYINIDRLFCSFESVSGFRNLKYESELQSDFAFERVNVIAETKLFSILSLSLLFTAEWEWHRQQEENSQLYLLSSSLTYAF